MPAEKTVLILGGTAEARGLADTLVDTHGERLRIVTSLAGRTTSPRHPKGEVRDGGFGGADGLAAYLKDEGVDLLIDATHPYAAQISRHAADAAEETGTPRLSLVRPPWQETDGDRWTHVADMAAAAAAISRASDACLITTGIGNLDAFAGIMTTKLFVRLIEKPAEPLPLPDAEIVLGRPPYRTAEEVALYRLLGIDLLVSKNAGGDGTRAKIDAARELGIPVIMIDRPPHPGGETVTSVEDSVVWVGAFLTR